MNAGMVVAGKRNRYMRRFRDAGATFPAGARSLEELNCRSSFVFRRLVRRGVFVQVSTDRYYMDAARATAFRARRRMVALVVMSLALILTLIALWMTRAAS